MKRFLQKIFHKNPLSYLGWLGFIPHGTFLAQEFEHGVGFVGMIDDHHVGARGDRAAKLVREARVDGHLQVERGERGVEAPAKAKAAARKKKRETREHEGGVSARITCHGG